MCICVKCFLNGQHGGHSFQIYIDNDGNCDCGDSCYCDPSGFCCCHRGCSNDPDIDQLESEIRQDILDFSKLIFQNLNDINALLFLPYLQQLVFLGDGMRRCVSFGSFSFLESFIQKIHSFSNDSFELLFQLFGSLTNETMFITKFSEIIFSRIDIIIKNIRFIISGNLEYSKFNILMNYFFHFFSVTSFNHLFNIGFDLPKVCAKMNYDFHLIVSEIFDTKKLMQETYFVKILCMNKYFSVFNK
jgi:hypothetical protein